MDCLNCNAELPDQAKFCLECGSSVSGESKGSSLELSIGDMRTVGGLPTSAAGVGEASAPPKETLSERYELLEEIGRGGFAVVHKATDKKLGRTVAIKKLHAGHDAQTLERFRREARVIAGLNHRNIVGVHDVGEDADGIYLVMEYVEGGSLREYLKVKGALELDESLKLISGILQGLSYAHRRNLVHRDIKPANILLQNEDGESVPKVVDFGLAQAGRDSELSMTGYGMGSPYYMPPEQRRDAKGVNHTADIYAVGKVLYEMVSGQIPDTLDPSMIPSGELANIIFKCTKPQPHDRYFSVDELLRELEAIQTAKHAKVPRKEFGNQQSEIGNSNRCPACGVGNPSDVKFCVKCGAGLTYLCGECGREESAHNRYCGACGTDIPGFKEATEIFNRMEAFRQEMKWSRVQKEFSLLDSSVRLPGEKGRGLKEKMKDLTSLSKQLDPLWKSVEEAINREDFESAYKSVVNCLALDPDNRGLLQHQNELLFKAEPRAGAEKVLDLGGDVTLELVWIPPTTSEQWKKLSKGNDYFLMGSPDDEEGRNNGEIQHEVRLTQGFWMAKYPVTQAQYEFVMGDNYSYFRQADKGKVFNQEDKETQNHPVERVSINNAKKVSKRVGEMVGLRCCLPTEAQWEYACRAGIKGVCIGRLDELAWYASNSESKTHPVGQKQANVWGLHDMHGNVWEWCLDDWHRSYKGAPVDGTRWGDGSGSSRVIRGGSCYVTATRCRSAARSSQSCNGTDRDLGFRLIVQS